LLFSSTIQASPHPTGAMKTQPEGGGGHFYKKKLPDGGYIGQDHQSVGADLVRQFMRRNRYPNARIDRVQKLVQNHMWKYFDTEKGARKFLREAGDMKTAWDLLLIRQADASGKHGNDMNEYDTQALANAEALLRKVIDNEAATSIKDLAVNGKDLMDAGMKPGPEIGRVLKEMLERVIDNPELNTRESLLAMLPYV
jgi:tRNA nucleotidyltransferase (CCA-adding enzyme)